jgi:UDP-N-acetylmuramoyl-tripeptide--D-alanyl-D-alanine ligase
VNTTLGSIAAASSGSLRGAANLAITGVSTDTRTLRPGQLFVAIRGEKLDGNTFLGQAAQAGAAAALIDRDCAAPPLPTVLVDDSVRALGALAAERRARFSGPVVAITGSNGKSTTKEMCAQILAAAGLRVRRTPGNLNNHIGLPLSILALEDSDQALVVELGMNHPGEIDALARIARPDVGAITQVAAAHLGPMGSLEAIGRAKGELYDHIGAKGTGILNADDPWVMAQARRCAGRHVHFGFAASAEYRAEGAASDLEKGRFVLASPRLSGEIALPVPGRHMIANALCALAAAEASGLLRADFATVRRALEDFRGMPGRLALRACRDGLRILDDTYNANPESLRAALRTLAALAAPGRAFAVLGDMLELGDDAERLHEESGRTIAGSGVTALIGVGPLAACAVAGARAAGLACAESAADPAAAARRIRQLAVPGDLVLIKGSRGSRMERVASALEESAT